MKSGSTPQLRVALAVLALALALPASATTYVMPSDGFLVDTSAAAVQARVLSVDSAPGADLPSTDYMIEVERVLSGEVTGRNLIVRVPGGIRLDGIGLKLEGMPEMRVGERVVLFLNPSHNPRSQGTWAVSHLMLGAFHEVLHNGERFLVRNLAGAVELGMPGEDPGARERFHNARRAEAFSRWIEERGRGNEPTADYFAEPDAGLDGSDGVASIQDQFRLFVWEPNGLNIRWFEFDEGGNVEWRMQNGGQPGYSAQSTAQAIRSGFGVWNTDNGSIVNYTYGGTTPSTAGETDDGVNAVTFADPSGAISTDFTCAPGGGGTLAIGGPFFETRFPRPGPGGTNYNVAVEGFIVTNKGIECFLTAPGRNAQRVLEQLIAHEFGHTLGIDHPCEPDEGLQCNAVQRDALMYPFLHTDGRAAVLNSDDRKAIRFLYPGSSAPEVPAAPTNLAAELIDATSVLLTWQDNADDESSFVIETSISGAGFETLATVAANTESLELSDLEDETTYRFLVKARNSQGSSVPSNEVELATELGLPEPPGGLVAQTGSATSVVLTWEDQSDNETDFVVEALTFESDGEWFEVQSGITADPDSSTVGTTVEGLDSGVPHTFRVQARNSSGLSGPSDVDAATPDENPDGCVEDETTLCLLDDRFRVRTVWRNFRTDPGITGEGQTGDDLGNRTGTFWFFNKDNIELIVKVLDGTSINQFYWTFYGALSDVEYWITVMDTEDGDSRTYYNPPEGQCGRLDNASIPVDLLTGSAGSSRTAAVAVPLVVNGKAETGACVPSDTTLCLLDDRFAVEVDWVIPNDSSGEGTGEGTAVEAEASERIGYFWFFREDNIELVVKALDGRVVNGHFWFFYGALSDVEYEIKVTDTVAGRTRTYRNEFGNQCGQLDNAAFLPEDGE